MLKLTSSQLKLTPLMTNEEIGQYEISSASMLKNEPFSFELVYRSETELRQPITVSVKTELPAEEWRIDYVPVSYAANDYGESGYVGDLPGLYPDLLEPRPVDPELVIRGGDKNDPDSEFLINGNRFENNTKYLLNANKQTAQSLLVTINPDGELLKPGVYEIVCTMRALVSLAELGKVVLRLEVIDALLPEQTECYTNWFHVDSLCDFYGVEPYSNEFYELFKSFISNAVKHRMNTLLLPAFTPALDTPIGYARRNVQLVDITRTESGWEFGFERLKRFMQVASECGIRYFEHCHLFSQWGAKNAPCIYDADGNLLFGWKTDAAGEEYTEFIRAYLKAFIAFVRGEGYEDRQIIFHISDEPTGKQIDGYRIAHDTIADLIEGFDQIDALSDVDFYSTGLVRTPVAFAAEAENFEGKCPRFWLYYTCGPYARNCSNRLITNTAARTRVLGLQMYNYKAAGFLQWGYNFYYDRMSEGWFDPKVNPNGYKLMPGCSYLCYPESDGAVPSLREVHMREAFDDLRALKLLEMYIGRDKVLELITETVGKPDNHLIPEKNALYSLRETVNGMIKGVAKCTE